MTQLLHPVTAEPTAVFERPHGDIQVQDRHPRETAVIRVDVPMSALPTAIGEAICEIEGHLAEAGVEVAGPPFVRYLSFDPAHLVADVGCPVLRPAPKVGRMGPGQLPGGRIASIVHIGPYEALAATYELLQQSLTERGMTASGPMWEVYWSDPEAEPDPVTWRTEILQPVEPRD